LLHGPTVEPFTEYCAAMNTRRHAQVVNIDELEPMEHTRGRFGARAKRLGAPAGAKAIGFNWMELKPGNTSFPYHYHTGIEEGLYILAGSGELRIGKNRVPVRQGDYIAFPAGPDHAHSLTNSGKQPLQYLSFSNQNTTDIVGYPDSKKFAFGAIPDPSTWPQGMWVRKLIRDQESVDYFDGEDTGAGPNS
jgi:uncharacterized cupin superfamily protein